MNLSKQKIPRKYKLLFPQQLCLGSFSFFQRTAPLHSFHSLIWPPWPQCSDWPRVRTYPSSTSPEPPSCPGMKKADWWWKNLKPLCRVKDVLEVEKEWIAVQSSIPNLLFHANQAGSWIIRANIFHVLPNLILFVGVIFDDKGILMYWLVQLSF